MKKEMIIDKLDVMNIKMNQIIGRLTAEAMTGNIPVKEAHRIALEVGDDLDQLINELL